MAISIHRDLPLNDSSFGLAISLLNDIDAVSAINQILANY